MIEPELARPTPRTVRADSVMAMRLRFVRRFAIVPIVIGLSMLVVPLVAGLVTVAGKTVTGHVLGTGLRRSKNIAHWDVAFEYVADGATQRGSETFDFDPLVEASQAIEVTYLGPIATAKSPRGRSTIAVTAGGLSVFALLWNLFTAMMFWRLVWLPIRWERLVRDGTPIDAEILEVAVTPRNSSNKVRYRFGLDGGRFFEGTTSFYDSAPNALAAGSRATVLYDPADPKKNVLYAVCPYRAA